MLLIRGGRIAGELLEAEFAHIGLSVPYATILTALLENGPRHSTDLCNLTMRERANMSVLLRKLNRSGYVSEKPNPMDARSHLVELTPAGNEVALKCREIIMRVSGVLDEFLAQHGAADTRFRQLLADLVGKFYSIYT